MRLDLAAGNDTFQAAKGTGDHREVVAEMAGPLVGPEVPSEANCKKLLSDSATRNAWVVNEDDDGEFATVKVKFSKFQAVWVAKILHEAEKLRGVWKAKKATEQEVRDAWYTFHLGAPAPGSGQAPRVVMDFADVAAYFEDGEEEKLEALVAKMEKQGAIINR